MIDNTTKGGCAAGLESDHSTSRLAEASGPGRSGKTEPGPTPQRIQLRRVKGWRKPEGAIVVARPTKYANPYPVDVYGLTGARVRFRRHLARSPVLVADARKALAGRDLGCWCPLDTEWCHADDWIAIAGGATLPLGTP